MGQMYSFLFTVGKTSHALALLRHPANLRILLNQKT